MNVPISINSITVDQYREIVPIYKMLQEDISSEKYLNCWANIIAIIGNLQVDEVERWPLNHGKRSRLRKLKDFVTDTKYLIPTISKLQFLSSPEFNKKPKKYIFLKGRFYKATLEAKDLNTAQYIEIKTFAQGDISKNLHKILASLYRPLTWKGFVHDGANHEKHAERFRDAKLGKVYPAFFLLSNHWKNSIKVTQAYGAEKALQTMKEALNQWEEIQKENLNSAGVGMS